MSNPFSAPPYHPVNPFAPASAPAAPPVTTTNPSIPFPLYNKCYRYHPPPAPIPWNITNTGTMPLPFLHPVIPIPLSGDVCGDLPAAKKKKSDGCTCKKCKEFYQYAEPNQEDGTLICYGCRMVWK